MHLGISARLTAVALTKLGDVSTVAKTLVEALNDVLQNLADARFEETLGSCGRSVRAGAWLARTLGWRGCSVGADAQFNPV